MSDSFVVERPDLCHSNRLGLSSRLTPNLGGWGEEKWGEIQKNPKNLVKKFTFFAIVVRFLENGCPAEEATQGGL